MQTREKYSLCTTVPFSSDSQYALHALPSRQRALRLVLHARAAWHRCAIYHCAHARFVMHFMPARWGKGSRLASCDKAKRFAVQPPPHTRQ